MANGVHCWHTTHLHDNWNNDKNFIYHLKMSHEHVNGKKKFISQIYEKLEGPHDGQVL